MESNHRSVCQRSGGLTLGETGSFFFFFVFLRRCHNFAVSTFRELSAPGPFISTFGIDVHSTPFPVFVTSSDAVQNVLPIDLQDVM